MMSGSKQQPRVTFFEMREEGATFMEAANSLLGEQIRAITGQRVPKENHRIYSHGRSWRHPANEYAVTGEMTTHQAEYLTSFVKIVSNDFGTIIDMFNSIIGQLSESSSRMFYEQMSKICDESGQTVDANGKPFPEALMDAFRKIEFSVDRAGNVVLPEIHVGSLSLIDQLKAMGSEYHAEFERLKAEKIERAQIAEAERRSRFKRPRP